VPSFRSTGWLWSRRSRPKEVSARPYLETCRQPIEAMGKAAVAMLVNQIENVAVYPEELLFEPELVVRGSTGRPASAGS
jgi:DNA-binding LacI/PurR family transcriptional regulator